MKVLIVTPTYFPDNITGAERVAANLVSYLRQKGHTVGVCSGTVTDTPHEDLDFYRPLRAVRSKIARKLLFDYYNPFATRDFEKALKEFKPDVVHFHHIYGLGSYLLEVSKRYAATVVTAHDYWSVCFNSTLMHKGKLYPYGYKSFLKPTSLFHKKIHMKHLEGVTLTAPSQYLGDALIRNGLKVHKIKYAIGTHETRTSYSDRIIIIARLVKTKGVQVVLPSLVKLAGDNEIVVVGDGPLLEQLKQDFPTVTFTGFAKPDEFYSSARLLVIPSIWPENQPMVILESFTYGLPVLASKIGGNIELIENSGAGLLYTHDDMTDFEAKFDEIMKIDPRVLGEKALQYVSSEHNWSTLTDQYVEVYEQALLNRQNSDSE